MPTGTPVTCAISSTRQIGHEPQRARLPLRRRQGREGRRHPALRLVGPGRRRRLVVDRAERHPAPQPLGAQPVAGEVAGDREQPGPHGHPGPPAVAMTVQAEERVHRHVVRRRRVVQHARQMPAQRVLPAAEQGLERRSRPPLARPRAAPRRWAPMGTAWVTSPVHRRAVRGSMRGRMNLRPASAGTGGVGGALMQAMADLVFLVLGAVAVVGCGAIVALVAMEATDRPGARAPPSRRSPGACRERHDAAPLRRLSRPADRRRRAARHRRLPRLMLRERMGRPASPEAWERVHDRTARGLHDLGIHLAGFFVKLCQIVGARADVFAAAVHPRVSAASTTPCRRDRSPRCGSRIETRAGPAARRGVRVASTRRRSPRRRWRRCTAPSLRDGTAVAVKVQYPEVARLARVDLAEPAHRWRAFAGGLAAELRRAQHRRRDRRARWRSSSTSPARRGRPSASAPRWRTTRPCACRGSTAEYTTGKLLVLEFLDGIKVTDLDRLTRRRARPRRSGARASAASTRA